MVVETRPRPPTGAPPRREPSSPRRITTEMVIEVADIVDEDIERELEAKQQEVAQQSWSLRNLLNLLPWRKASKPEPLTPPARDWAQQVAHAQAIFEAIGSPKIGAVVSLTIPLVDQASEVAHQPVAAALEHHGFILANPTQAPRVNHRSHRSCDQDVQADMVGQLIVALGAKHETAPGALTISYHRR